MEAIKIIKSDLEKATLANDTAKISSLKNKLIGLREESDNEIRTHQREIDFRTQEFTVEVLKSKYEDGLNEGTNELFVPDYQREFKWNEERQSKLIESLLIGLPIPYIFTADIKDEDPESDGKVEIVDGAQRIRTIHAFLNNKLELQKLKLLKELNGFKFEDLTPSRQRRFLRIPIRIIELSEKCDEMTRRDLFERINSGSLQLVSQEKRHGSKIADTPFYKQVITACAENDLLHKLAPVSDAKKKSGEYLELVIRFFAYKDNFDTYTGEVEPFLNTYLEGKGTVTDATVFSDYKIMFNNMLNFVQANFEYGFRKSENFKSTPRARFEAISVGTALALEENRQPKTDQEKVSEWIISKEFLSATTSDGSNNVGNFRNRINFVKDKILGNT